MGNPGEKYKKTRHNFGFLIAEEFAGQIGSKFRRSFLHKCFLAEGILEDRQILLMKPATYMNNSGMSIKKLLDRKGITLDNILIIHDDLDLPFGRLRFKKEGSDAGHRGLRSIANSLRTRQYARLKCGIGRPRSDQDAAEYVLSLFDETQQEELPSIVKRALKIISSWALGKEEDVYSLCQKND